MPPQQQPIRSTSTHDVEYDENDENVDSGLFNSNVPPLPSRGLRNSVIRRESFLVQFAKTKGPPQITLLMMLIAVGLGSTIGVVPAVMTDRFARLYHGYSDDQDRTCHDPYWTTSEEGGGAMPEACVLGSADAQSAVATSNLISNCLTFLMSSLLGSLSDEYGRKGVLILGLMFGIASPLMLVLIQLIPAMSPWWYYGFHASTGLVNWIAIALSALADVLPQRFRAPGIGLLLAGFMLGFSFAPILAFFLSDFQLSVMSFLVVAIGLIATVLFVPETLPPAVAIEAKARRFREMESIEGREVDLDNQYGYSKVRRGRRAIIRFLKRPLKEMSILNRDTFFRLISLLAFFSGMVSSGDQILLVYYIEERLGFTTQDVSVMFLIMGIMGLIAQGVLLKPLVDRIGEKRVVAFCFLIGAIDNTMYGLAKNKATIYAAVAMSALTGMSFPTISAIKSNNVAPTEQGRIQGALYSLQALASGIGPVLLRTVYGLCKDSTLGPGAMFIFAGGLYLVAVATACALPAERANARPHEEDEVDMNLGLNDFRPLPGSPTDSDESHASYGSMA